MAKRKPSTFIWLAVLTTAMIVPPLVIGGYYVDILTRLLINIILVASFRLISLTGDFSVAHVPLMGAGAYGSALMGIHLGLPFWVSLPLAGLVSAAISLAMCYPLLRMRAFAFFIGSFAAGEAMRLIWVRLRVPFGGQTGLTNIPPPESIPGLAFIDFGDASSYYRLTLGITLVCLGIMYWLEKSRIGATLKAIHSQEDMVKSVGINVTRYRTLALVIGSFFAGISGVLLVHHVGFVDPYQFSLGYTLYLLIWSVVGGLTTFAGPIIGVATLTAVSESLRGFVAWEPMFYGLIMLAIFRFLPHGLESLPERSRVLLEKARKIVGARH